MTLVERILYNGNIITLDHALPRVSALAIIAGRIVAAGTDDEILALAGPDTKKDNLDGKTLIPGMTDAHIHWKATAGALREVDVFEVASKHIAVQRVADRAAITPAGEWIIGRGWSQDFWPDGAFPSAADLDGATTQHPVLLLAKSVHAAWLNSSALRRCGIDENTPDPAGGQIGRDAQGKPNGLLFETAMHLAYAHLPQRTPSQLADDMLVAQELALASGLTGIHDFDNPDCLVSLQILRERGQLGLRVLKQINKDWLDHAIESGIRQGFGDDWIRFGGLKLFADGALGPRTASMIEPYDGEPENYGIIVTDKEEMMALASKASAAGLASAIHAIGDRAVHDVLDVFAALRQQEVAQGALPASRQRHRIEHVQIIHPEDAARLAQLGIIASMQPLHATSDYEAASAYWGDRSQWAYNIRLQLDQGAMVALGSDSPVEPFAPLRGIYAAVTRHRPDGSPGIDGWYPALRLTVDEALRGFTIGPAYAANMESRLGRLKVGFLADAVLLDRDPYQIAPEELLELRVVATMVDGTWRYGGV